MEGFQAEGGLDHRSWCCITESVIHHRSKLTRQGPAGPAFRRRHAAAVPACPAGPGMWPAETARTMSRDGPRAGPDPGSHSTRIDHQGSAGTASRRRSPVPAPQPRKPAQMTLAAELNPYESELNPHEAVPGG